MLLVIPVSHVDFDRTVELAGWMRELSASYSRHSCLIVASKTIETIKVTSLSDSLKECAFNAVSAIQLTVEDPRGWPYAPNVMFRTAAEYVRKLRPESPWLWLESDAIPLKHEWLDTIHDAYFKSGSPFMGTVFDRPWRHMTGVAVYPWDVQRYNPYMLTVTSRMPFDTVRPEMTLPYTTTTSLIQHVWGDVEKNIPPTFPTLDSIKPLSPRAVIFHRNKDGTLISRLRESKHVVDVVPKSNWKQTVRHTGQKVKALLGFGDTYYHSGNLGDIIYSLYAIKLQGHGHLILGPEQNKTSPCSQPISREAFDMLLPLLKRQPYIDSVTFQERYPRDMALKDLNVFRDHWHNPRIRREYSVDSLCKMHCYTIGVLNRFDEDHPWLVAHPGINARKLVVHRSARYHARHFPWKEIANELGDEMLFVGLEQEWASFQSDIGRRVSYWKVRDFLEMAQIIAGAKCFIGNQSFQCALALACGQNVLQESWIPGNQDCLFHRKNFMNQIDFSINKLKAWL